MYQILDGKELARKIREELKLKVDKLKENGIVPKLAVILVGDDSASKVYDLLFLILRYVSILLCLLSSYILQL